MIAIFTLAFNASPFIERQLPIFQQLKTPWRWIVIHGPSTNGGSTKWCQPQQAKWDTDGTREYLHSLEPEQARVISKKLWKSKDEMVNAALACIDEPCILLQVDADEIWEPERIDHIAQLFTDRPQLSSIMFACRYFVGPRLITQGTNCFGDNSYEWLRAWRYEPGRKFTRHEPPVLEGDDPGRRMSKEESRALGLVFDHHSYATEEQVEYKSRFYGYGPGLVESWRKLQEHDKFPCDLARFFPFLKPNDSAKVVRV